MLVSDIIPLLPKTNSLGSPMGLWQASTRIYRTGGLRGLFQGHSATLLRIFPYAGVKFMTYDWAESVSRGAHMELMMQVLITSPDQRTPGRFFVAGAFSGKQATTLYRR
jgi:solute carrier family 25 protein 16